MIARLRLALARWLLPRGWHAHRDPRPGVVRVSVDLPTAPEPDDAVTVKFE